MDPFSQIMGEPRHIRNLGAVRISFRFGKQQLLVLYSARSHISTRVKKFLHDKKILFAVISGVWINSGGLTGLLQPADVVWFKQLKSDLETSIEEWKRSENHSVTRGGNARPPTTEELSGWLYRAWQRISTDTITRSFSCCLLGDSLRLHIAQHELYGRLFRQKLVELMENTHAPRQDEDDAVESDIAEIDDE